MIGHDKPRPAFTYSLATQRNALRRQKQVRSVPDRTSNKLLVATWNLTNLGVQNRSDNDLKLMAEIISWFDLVAVQEIADDISDLRKLVSFLPRDFGVIISDPGGNDERAGFLYDRTKVSRLELAAEVAVPPSQQRHIRMAGVSGSFKGFDRNPYLVAFEAGGLKFTAVSVHLYFGSHSYRDEDRRTLEAYALSRWADLRHKDDGAYTQNILVMGDFNMPKREKTDPIFKALTRRGLELPSHSTKIGSNLLSDKDYDQVAFHKGGLKQHFTGQAGVFDFDAAPFFAAAWQRSPAYFRKAVKFHIADHRPLWAEFSI